MTEIVFSGVLRVPSWVQDLDSFRRWSLSEDYPDQGEISYLGGMLWVDPSMERDQHNQIKFEITLVVGGLVKANRLGRFYCDNMRLVHPEAGLSTEADAVFASRDSFQRQRVQLEQGTNSLELVGSPDMALEIVSPSSVEKDTIHLLNLYHKAGVKEYWLINPLGPTLEFTIYRYTPRKYVAVRPQDGWLKSTVFGESFRLTMTIGDLNLPEFNLEVR